VKGSEVIDAGLTALYQLETGVSYSGTSTTFAAGNRDSYVGVTGGFGTFLTGRLPAANQFVYDSNLFGDQLGDAANFTGGALNGVGRANSALHYVAPALGPVTVALTLLPAASMARQWSGSRQDQLWCKSELRRQWCDAQPDYF
jgi:predicted porin